MADLKQIIIRRVRVAYLKEDGTSILPSTMILLSNRSRGAASILVARRSIITTVQKQRIFALEQLLRCETMSILQEMHFESRLLNVVATGEFSMDEAKRAFLEMLGAVAQYRAEKVLFNGRNLKGKPGDLERFFYGEFAAQETIRLVQEHRIAPRFAYVIKEPLRDVQRFGETVALNRGMNVKTFETQEEAFEWLEINQAKKPDAADT